MAKNNRRETHSGQVDGKTVVNFYEDGYLIANRIYSKRWFAEREAASWVEFNSYPESQESIENQLL